MENTQPHFAASEKTADATETSVTATPAERKGSLHQLEHISLQGAGWLNLIGDVGLLAAGVEKKNPYMLAGGALYTAGAANLALLGKPGGRRLEHEMAEKTANFLESKSVTAPPHSELAAYQGKQSYWHKAETFLMNQPAQNTMLLYTGGAAAMLGNGLTEYSDSLKSGGPRQWKMLAYGASSLGFKTAAMLIPEKKNSEEPITKEPETLTQKVGAWIQEKPLRFFGYGSFITDGFIAWDNVEKIKKKGWNAKGNKQLAVTSVTYILADILMTLSHKDPENVHVTLNDKQLEKLMHQTAETLRVVPDEDRAKAVEDVSEFLAEQKQIKQKPGEISERLRAQLDMETPHTHIQQATAEMQKEVLQSSPILRA